MSHSPNMAGAEQVGWKVFLPISLIWAMLISGILMLMRTGG